MTRADSVEELSRALVRELLAAGRTVALAESCTGGWIAKSLTDVPGCSGCFAYGVVSYGNGAKETLLGVARRTLESAGAVSEATVREMADGVLRLSGADLAVAVSGIAGPDGGSADKPVGTVWFGWAFRDRGAIRLETGRQRFGGDRQAIREASVAAALQGLRERLRTLVEKRTVPLSP